MSPMAKKILEALAAVEGPEMRTIDAFIQERGIKDQLAAAGSTVTSVLGTCVGDLVARGVPPEDIGGLVMLMAMQISNIMRPEVASDA